MSRKTHVVDSNVILRWLTRDHEAYYAKAAAFWLEVREGRAVAYIPEAVLLECLFILAKAYSVPRVEAAHQIEALLALKNVVVDSRAEVLAALQLMTVHPISFADALVIAYARAKSATIESFDQDLLKAAKRG